MTAAADEDQVTMRLYELSTSAWRLAGSSALVQVEDLTGTDLAHLRISEVEDYLAGLDEGDTDGLWAELVGVGMADDPGVLKPAWAAAIVEFAMPQIGFRLVSSYGEVVGVADFSIRGPRAMGVMQRRRSHVEPSGEAVIDAVDTITEVAVFAAAEIWPAIRRCLPPVDELRADPALTPQSGRVDHTVPPVTRVQFEEQLRQLTLRTPGEILMALPDLDPALRDGLQTPQAVTWLAVTATPDGSSNQGLAIRAWTVGEGGTLYALYLRDTGPALVEVRPGALAFDTVWLVAGAAEFLAKAAATSGAGG